MVYSVQFYLGCASHSDGHIYDIMAQGAIYYKRLISESLELKSILQQAAEI